MIATTRAISPVRLLTAGLGLAAVAAFAMPAVHGAPPDQAVRFEILGGDIESDGLGEYIDHRLEGGTGDFCVESSITGGGFTFITLNRNIDGKRCDVAFPSETSRQYTLHIDSADACDELEASGDAYSTGSGTCAMDGHRNPRIRVDRLRQQGGTSTIDFLIGRQEGWVSGDLTYEVQSVGQATITPDGGSLLLEYDGPFRLTRFGLPKTKGKPGSGGPPEIEFNMSIQMRFEVEPF